MEQEVSVKTTRFFNFTKRFRGYQFFEKKTGDMVPKFMIFATYFKSWYACDGPELEFIDEEQQARFDMICREYIRVEDRQMKDGTIARDVHIPTIIPMGIHPLYGIRETPGWRRGEIVDKDLIFEKSNPGPEEPATTK